VFGEVHAFGHDHDALVRNVEQAAVPFQIETDFHAFGNHHVLVDDAALDLGVTADFHIFHQNAVRHLAEGIDPHPTPQKRPFHMPA